MKIISYIKKQLQNRTDTEHKQAILRLVIVFTSISYGTYIYVAKDASIIAAITCYVSLFISAIIVGHIIRKPMANPARRIVGAIHDNIFTTIFLYLAGADGALYLFVYPFITVGNGFRFGVKYLAFSGVLGILCVASLVFYNPAWNSDPTVGIGILLSNILVTLYTGILLNKLKLAQNKLEVMATHDVLTGLPNRACFMQKLDDSHRSNLENKTGLVCIYFDLDGFKAVNDIHGHKMGDTLLKKVASNVRGAVRSSDVFARLGGDEFTLLLDSKTDLDDAVMLSKRIITAIESIKELEGKQIKVSCSIGIAYLSSEVDVSKLCPEEILKIADEAMYKAKKSGKGRFELTKVDNSEVLNQNIVHAS